MFTLVHELAHIWLGESALTDLRVVDQETFFVFYYEYIAKECRRSPAGAGGDFYNNQNKRVGAFQEYACRLGADLPRV
jgi:hypothetical protein